MPALPKRLIIFGAGLAAVRTRRVLSGKDPGTAAQARIFRRLCQLLAGTEYGRASGMESGMRYDSFRTRVPLLDHNGLAPLVSRCLPGTPNVIVPGRVSTYARTAGTSNGTPRLVPVPDVMIRHFIEAWKRVTLHYIARCGRTSVMHGRHLLLGGNHPPAPIPGDTAGVATCGDITSQFSLRLPGWVVTHFAEPGDRIERLAGWQAKLDAIIEHTWNKDISMVAGLPESILGFVSELRNRVDAGSSFLRNLKSLWPRLECCVVSGSAAGPFQTALRETLGNNVRLHEVYAAAEGVFAIQDSDSSPGLRLQTDLDVLHEFVPATEFNDARPALSTNRAIPLAEVKPGLDYVHVITTPAGLVRFVPGDIVRFVSTEPPRVLWMGRVGHSLDSVGENVLEREVSDTLTGVCDSHGWRIVSFHVAPLPGIVSVTGHRNMRHEWWIELRAGTAETPTGPILASGLDRELARTNAAYASKRHSGALDKPVVRLVIPGVFEQYQRRQGHWGGLHRMPRCSSDRRIADVLTDLTRFTADTRAPWGR